jgi:tetratricopeptide (TPR) repeat protein
MTSSPRDPVPPPGAPGDAAAQLGRLWQQGGRPDLDAFLGRVGPLPPAQLAAVLRVDQRQRWLAGEPVPAEAYLQRYAGLRGHPADALDLIYNEFLLRERYGEPPSPDEYLRRFPEYAATLRDQMELHRALVADSYPGTGSTEPPEGDPDPEGFAQRFPDLADALRMQVALHRALAASAATPAAQQPSGDTSTADLPGPAHLGLPERFGRYHIRRQIGEGGMGTVYLAHDTQLDRLVALKVPRFADPERVRRFLCEARAAAALEHPNICPVYDFGRVGGRCYLTMAYVEGESLATALKRGPLPQAEAAAVVRTLAAALGEAHRRGVVHRDLKPANILLNAKGQPVVTDFGLAKRLAPSAASSGPPTLEGILVGTPAYMAPEQVNGEAGAVGPATDVYALGVILYELLTGRPPFEGAVATTLVAVASQPPEPPSRRRPGIDPRLESVCLKALAKRPEDRIPSMAAFAAALDDWGTAPREVPLRRRRGWWAAGAGVGVVALTGCLLLWRPWQPPAKHGGGAAPIGPVGDDPAAVRRDRAAANAHADRGWVLNDAEDIDGAVRECEHALTLDDRCVKALLCRSNAYIKRREFDPALADLSRAMAIDPENPMPYIDRAWAYNQKGDHARAFADADRAVRLDPSAGEAYAQRGAARSGRGVFGEAVGDFTEAIERGHKRPWVYRHRAAAYRALRDAARAEQDEAAAAELERKK